MRKYEGFMSGLNQGVMRLWSKRDAQNRYHELISISKTNVFTCKELHVWVEGVRLLAYASHTHAHTHTHTQRATI